MATEIAHKHSKQSVQIHKEEQTIYFCGVIKKSSYRRKLNDTETFYY